MKPTKPKKPKAELTEAQRQLAADTKALLDFYSSAWLTQKKPADGNPPQLIAGDVMQARKWVALAGVNHACLMVNRYLADRHCLGAKNGWPLRQMPVDAYRAGAGAPFPGVGWARPAPAIEGSEVIDATHRLSAVKP